MVAERSRPLGWLRRDTRRNRNFRISQTNGKTPLPPRGTIGNLFSDFSLTRKCLRNSRLASGTSKTAFSLETEKQLENISRSLPFVSDLGRKKV